MITEHQTQHSPTFSSRDISRSASQIKRWRMARGAMATANTAQGPERILEMMLAEVKEAEAETVLATPEAVLAQAIELIDVLIILDSYIDYFGIQFEPEVIAHDKATLDGVGHWPDFYLQLAGVVNHALSQPEQNPQQFTNLIWSLVIARLRALALQQELSVLTRQVIVKNEYNYLQPLLDGTDKQGKPHSRVTQLRIYEQTVPLLKLVRKTFGSPLPPVISTLFWNYLADFENYDRSKREILSIIADSQEAQQHTQTTGQQVKKELSKEAAQLYQLLLSGEVKFQLAVGTLLATATQ